jgi:hypothetical protein
MFLIFLETSKNYIYKIKSSKSIQSCCLEIKYSPVERILFKHRRCDWKVFNQFEVYKIWYFIKLYNFFQYIQSNFISSIQKRGDSSKQQLKALSSFSCF